jgi:hypothetical protein
MQVAARRFIAVTLLACLTATVPACGTDDQQVAVFPVTGQVLHRGQPAAGAIVSFHPTAAELKSAGLVISGRTGADGSYQLMTYEEGDGAPAGEYQVSIIWRAAPAGNDGDEVDRSGADRLAGKYQDPALSGLTAEVEEADNRLPPFNLE